MGQNRFLEKKTAPVYPIPKKKFQFLQPRGKKSKISKKNALKCSQSRFFRENFFLRPRFLEILVMIIFWIFKSCRLKKNFNFCSREEKNQKKFEKKKKILKKKKKIVKKKKNFEKKFEIFF